MNLNRQDGGKYTTALNPDTKERIDALTLDYCQKISLGIRCKKEIFDLVTKENISPTLIANRLGVRRGAITNIIRRIKGGDTSL